MRTEAQGEENLALISGTDKPGVALPGGGTGKAYESPTEKLSQLIEQLNQRYGMNLGEADLVWFRQQKQAIKSHEVRPVSEGAGVVDLRRTWLRWPRLVDDRAARDATAVVRRRNLVLIGRPIGLAFADGVDEAPVQCRGGLLVV